MILLIRENASNQTVDFLWNGNTTNLKGSKSFFTKPMTELESFWRSWESLVFRNGNSINPNNEIVEEINKKREWLIGLVGFKQLDSSILSKIKVISIQSDTKWLSLPWELLVNDKVEGRNQTKIVREFLTPSRQFSPVKTDQAFFLFQTDFGGKIEVSVEREYEQLKALNWKKLTPKFYKNGLARVERVKEILPSASIFHLASHLDPSKWSMPDGSVITSNEIESMNLSGLELIFLNGCYSTFGLAQSFLRSGAKEVVGFSTAIPNELSEKVSKIFWTEWTKTYSSYKAYIKVRKNLEHSIFLYSWIRFGEVKVRRFIPWISYAKVSLIPVIAFGIFLLLQSQINQKLDDMVSSQNYSKAILSKPQLDSGEDKPSLPNKKGENILTQTTEYSRSKVTKKVLLNSKPQIEKSSTPLTSIANKDNKIPTQPSQVLEEKKQIDIWEEYRSKLPPSFINKIQIYIEDESELVPRNKRILLVKRILEQNQTADWKQDVFSRETGR